MVCDVVKVAVAVVAGGVGAGGEVGDSGIHTCTVCGAVTYYAMIATPRMQGNAMSAPEMQLLAKLKRLPPETLAEVENFVDFLALKLDRDAAFDRLLAIAPALEAAKAEPICDEEVAALIHKIRAERRARSSHSAAHAPGS